MFAEKQGWWLLKEIRVLPVEGEKISPTLWVQEVVYIGNSKFFVADELNKNWHCVLLNKRKTAAKKKRPKKKTKNPQKTLMLLMPQQVRPKRKTLLLRKRKTLLQTLRVLQAASRELVEMLLILRGSVHEPAPMIS